MVARATTMEHDELVREMALVERLTTQERLKLARRRRKEQLRLCLARDRDGTVGKRRKSEENWSQRRRNRDDRIHFVDGVVLLEAASRNDVEEVRCLLESGVDPDSTNEDGLTALHQCCIDDSEAMMTVLLDHGANVDAEDSERWTPLHAAATCGHLHLVRQLVERGANLLAVNADGNMAYDICEHNAALEYIEMQMARRGITQELIEETRGQLEAEMLADLQERPTNRLEERVDQDAAPLHVAAANGYLSVVRYLLDNHVAVGPCDKDDWQPIHAAACWGHLRAIELLYQHGADLTARTRNGETAFDVCEDPEIRDRLEQLRNEQELKRTAETQPSRVRRTQSTKHSIRRTSMRQKTLTPKKDVKEEARIRLGVEGSMKSELDESKLPVDLHDISITVPGINGTNTPTENGDGVTGLTDPRKTNGHQVNNNDQPDTKTNCGEAHGGGGAGGAGDVVDGEVEMKKFVSTVPGGGVTSEPPHEGTGCCVLQ